MTNRAKTEGHKARRAVEKAVQLFARYTPKDYDGFVGREISPHELAKHIAAEKLAADVREKLTADSALCDLRFSIEMIEAIDEHVVVEVLEYLVEGDDVIDDAATHQWFRKALDKHRDLCIEFDAFAKEIGDFATAIGLGMACEQYDILFDGVVGGRPGDVGVFANREGRRIFSEMLPPDQWRDLLPEKIGPFADWKQSTFELGGPNGPPTNPIKFIAETIAKNSSLRVGIVKEFGHVDPVSAEAR
jgi:hypothetical protein